jgi:hypothetical protein
LFLLRNLTFEVCPSRRIGSKFFGVRLGCFFGEISEPGGFKMILEIFAIFLLLLLIHCASRISRLIMRRRDVLYYVSKSDRTMDDELLGNFSP